MIHRTRSLVAVAALVVAVPSAGSTALAAKRPNAGQFCSKAMHGKIVKPGNGRRVKCAPPKHGKVWQWKYT
jgi:hypothetical protein